MNRFTADTEALGFDDITQFLRSQECFLVAVEDEVIIIWQFGHFGLVLSWLRKAPGAPTVVVAANFTADPQTVSLAVPGSTGKLKTLLKSPGAAEPASLTSIELGPFEVFIGEVK